MLMDIYVSIHIRSVSPLTSSPSHFTPRTRYPYSLDPHTHHSHVQVICGMYGRHGAPDAADCWEEPSGLAAHSGVTADLCRKFINHCIGAINACVHKHMPNMNDVGSWTQQQIESIVLPCAGDMNEVEVTNLDDIDEFYVDNDMIDEVE